MTPNTLSKALAKMPQGAPLVFETPTGAINGGYHVTEWKLSHVKGIDCGAHQRSWTEARLQLLDGYGGAHMSVGTFRGILEKSMGALPELGDTPFEVEFSNGNTALEVFGPEDPELKGDRAHIPLHSLGAVCKPAERRAEASCCGADPGC